MQIWMGAGQKGTGALHKKGETVKISAACLAAEPCALNPGNARRSSLDNPTMCCVLTVDHLITTPLLTSEQQQVLCNSRNQPTADSQHPSQAHGWIIPRRLLLTLLTLLQVLLPEPCTHAVRRGCSGAHTCDLTRLCPGHTHAASRKLIAGRTTDKTKAAARSKTTHMCKRTQPNGQLPSRVCEGAGSMHAHAQPPVAQALYQHVSECHCLVGTKRVKAMLPDQGTLVSLPTHCRAPRGA